MMKIKILSYIKELAERNRTLRELYRLDDRMLADIGISRSDIYYKVSKPRLCNYIEFKEPDFSKVQAKYI
jgi:uncharacterized protein YjiS (DUF1127 family)